MRFLKAIGEYSVGEHSRTLHVQFKANVVLVTGSGDSPMTTPLAQPTSNSPKASPSVSDDHKVHR